MARRSAGHELVYRPALSLDTLRETPARPYKPRAKAVTSRMMSAVKATGNKAEVKLRRVLWSRGFRYRLYAGDLPGRPDIVFRRFKTVVFVDGDFWHARVLLEKGAQALRKSIRGRNKVFWIKKLSRNAERDREIIRAYVDRGWRIIRIWESDVLAAPDEAAEYVIHVLLAGSPSAR